MSLKETVKKLDTAERQLDRAMTNIDKARAAIKEEGKPPPPPPLPLAEPRAFHTLTPRECEVLILTYVPLRAVKGDLKTPLTQREIATRHNVTGSRIHQIVYKALQKLEGYMSDEPYV